MKRQSLWVWAGLVLLTSVSARATTYIIRPDGTGDLPTVQAGLNASMDGDTVLATPGTYNENLFWPGRNGIVLAGSVIERPVILADGNEVALLMVNTVMIDSSTVIRDVSAR